MKDKISQFEFWNDVAGPRWVASQKRLDAVMAPLTEALLQIAVPEPGEHVLDVGCGCGDVALRAALAVGSGGRVTGIDISKPMLGFARERQRAEEPVARAPIDWIDADAMTHRFEAPFDLIVSRFGVMFFDDRERAFANLRAAAKSPGRFAFLAWRGRAESEWFQAPLDWIAPALPMPEASDGEAGPFAFADGERTREQLAAAGFHDVIAEPLDRALVIGESAEEAAAMLLDTGPAAALIREADPAQREAAETLLREGVERQAGTDGRIVMRGACYIFRGKA